MTELSKLFRFHNSKSRGFDGYQPGDIRFVTNGFYNNGVQGLVMPFPGDRVFQFKGICVSAFCEATVQEPPFLPRGNGGSGLLVLEPERPMTHDELVYYAAFMNESIRWRFSFGRMVSGDRLKRHDINEFDGTIHPSRSVDQLIPEKKDDSPLGRSIRFVQKGLNDPDMFEVKKGIGAYRENLSSGRTPLISATGGDNGILDYVELAPTFIAPAITVERVGGRAFIQLRDFATVPADISVLVPRNGSMSLSRLFMIASLINAERWRYSYGRKLTAGRLKKMRIPIPVADPDEHDLSGELLRRCYGWKEISESFDHHVQRR